MKRSKFARNQGIRISDSRDNVLDITLSDILEEIQNGSFLKWSILFLDGMPNPEEEKFLSEYQNRISKSKNGLRITWGELNLVGSKFSQIFETVILGCKKQESLCRYINDHEMYQSCDVVIELIDCAFWQVFSKDQELIKRLKEKFKETELLEPNFEK